MDEEKKSSGWGPAIATGVLAAGIGLFGGYFLGQGKVEQIQDQHVASM